MVSEKRTGVGDRHLQFGDERWFDGDTVDCALADAEIRLAHGFCHDWSTRARLDCCVARFVSTARGEFAGFRWRVGADSERSGTSYGDGSSLANDAEAAPGLGRGIGEVFHRSDLVCVFVLDAGLLEPQSEARPQGNGVASVCDLHGSKCRKYRRRMVVVVTDRERLGCKYQP